MVGVESTVAYGGTVTLHSNFDADDGDDLRVDVGRIIGGRWTETCVGCCGLSYSSRKEINYTELEPFLTQLSAKDL